MNKSKKTFEQISITQHNDYNWSYNYRDKRKKLHHFHVGKLQLQQKPIE